MGIGRALASDTSQDLVAGQHSMQKALIKALREGDLDTVTRVLSRERAREDQEREN